MPNNTPISIITSNTTALLSDLFDIYYIDATYNDIIFTLPNIDLNNGLCVTLFRIDSSSNNVTINAFNKQTINNLLYVNIATSTKITFLSLNINWTSNALSQGVTPGMRLTNYIYVDKGGNDTSGIRNGNPFLTISAALIVSYFGDVVIVSPGIYTESLIIPNGVTVKSNSILNTIISKTVKANTDLITLNSNCSLENFTLILTATINLQLTGINFVANSASNSRIENCSLTINNSTAIDNTLNVIGIYSAGTGNAPINFINIDNVSVNIALTDLNNGSKIGIKRGILLDTNINTVNVRNSSFIVIGLSNTIAAETNFTLSNLNMKNCICSGQSADISQTLGSINLSNTRLFNSNANGKSFNVVDIFPRILQYSFSGIVGSNSSVAINRFMKISDTLTISENKQLFYQSCTVRNMYICAKKGPGIANNVNRVDTFSVRKTLANSIGNASDTNLVGTISGSNLIGSNIINSVTFASGDLISVSLIISPLSILEEVTLTLEIY
jgi:hypothetical protein